MSGAVELAPRLQIAQFICDLVSTGATLEANGLRPVETVLDSEAVLIRTRKPLSPERAELAEQMLQPDRRRARHPGDANISCSTRPRRRWRPISAMLPGAEAPTILPLAGRPGHFAVHAVCKESVFWETLQKLKSAGASAILVVPIEKMMM